MMSLRQVARLAQQSGPWSGALGAAGVCGAHQASTDAPTATKPSKRVVFISQSTDVFSNLAFEDWLYRNWSFERRQVLFLWRNSPCVVIGRHQNPWVEANLPYLGSAGVPFARRGSGGGTVYHDDANLNLTFFTARDGYNRRENLDVICRALQEDFGVDAQANHRDDIVVNELYKVSGSAAKLGRTAAYHHCTLLVGTDKVQLKLALQGDKSVESKATASVPAPVMNLSESHDISVEKLIQSIGRKYLESGVQHSNGYTLINPTDDWFPGLAKLKEELTSDSWLYGKTPRFTITRPVTLPECVAHNTVIKVTVQSYHGVIEDVKVVSPDVCSDIVDLVREVGEAMKGSPYSVEVFQDMVQRMRLPPSLRSQRSVL